ncbi:hypothetical protein Nepgr_029935 [Nepenthes gracilis]|uniref:SUEL-type lectin domain-containing protein n=1 Tax=Nepenthes gracilis TaxID=150966 RepID=A0AAD3Y3G6_NEPGR|nr:hypothetical protein Nepgr_029935 [Nepenthes gracilis]
MGGLMKLHLFLTFVSLLVGFLPSSTAAAGGGDGKSGKLCDVVEEGDSLTLTCYGGIITEITFASFGDPQGRCVYSNVTRGRCEAPTSLSVVKKACVDKSVCMVVASVATFGPTPCPGKRRLAVWAICAEKENV